MKSFKFLFLLIILSQTMYGQDIFVKDLTIEHRKNPVGIDVLRPRFSWKIICPGINIMQTAYSLKVTTDYQILSGRNIWESGKIESSESVLIEYGGPTLISGQRYFWQVKIWDNNGRVSKWSDLAYWEMGLLSPSDWKASWIEMDCDTNRFSPSPYFRKEFIISKPVKKAEAYITSHGFYELHINGKKAGDQVLTPGWTSYGKRLQYQVYDITAQVIKGENAIGAVIGDGWYRGTLVWKDNWAVYGKRLGLLLQIKITYTDGTEAIVKTDGSWKSCNNGAIRMSDIYDGETYDATKELNDWDLAGYDDTNWSNVRIGNYQDNLVASDGTPVKKIQEIKPVKIFKTAKGNLIADMGQNMVGWIRLKVSGTKGNVINLRHAEVLDNNGELYTDNLADAKAQVSYTLAGDGEEIYEPRFTFMGFRFVEITGYSGTLTTDNITGIVIHSEMDPSGTYECSNPLVNRLQQNILWGQKGNFIDIPTDCPQRSERLGWTGDAQVFCRTATYNFDVSAFFTKWLKDVTLDQRPNGQVPNVIPDVLDKQDAKTVSVSAGWGDASVIVPWTLYNVYGDKRLLEAQYTSMKAWVEYIRNVAGSRLIWTNGSSFGDWFFIQPSIGNHKEDNGFTEHDFIATAYFAYSAKILSDVADVLGKYEDAQIYSDLFNNIKMVFNYEYVTPAGRIGTNSQTSYILALVFDLLPEDLRSKAATFLVNDIKKRKNHLSTGFLGTPFICHALTKTGFTDVAYDLLLQETYPSWLYPIRMGATTMWERWDGIKPDSTFQDPNENSFNHYALGAIGDWMFRISAGIDTKTPGYKHINIQPHLTKRLDYAKATFESPYGTIASGWERKGGKIFINIKVPPNTRATVTLPQTDAEKIIENGTPVTRNTNFSDLRQEGNNTLFDTGSGEYYFEFIEL